MTRGKYAARALVRTDRAHEQVVAGHLATIKRLNEELAEVRSQLERVERDRDSDVLILADRLSAHRVEVVRAELETERLDRAADRGLFARRVFRVLDEHAAAMRMEGYAALAEVFGMGSQLGGLLPTGNRRGRRAAAAVARNTRLTPLPLSPPEDGESIFDNGSGDWKGGPIG